MREFIRHPTDIPIEYEVIGRSSPIRDVVENISQGGLCFPARESIQPGSRIRVLIPLLDPVFETLGTVVWSREVEPQHQVGVCFDDSRSEFNIRMIEQICHIEQYRRDVLETDARALTIEQAAHEWIERFAAEFP